MPPPPSGTIRAASVLRVRVQRDGAFARGICNAKCKRSSLSLKRKRKKERKKERKKSKKSWKRKRARPTQGEAPRAACLRGRSGARLRVGQGGERGERRRSVTRYSGARTQSKGFSQRPVLTGNRGSAPSGGLAFSLRRRPAVPLRVLVFKRRFCGSEGPYRPELKNHARKVKLK